jgi:hypothetical protein
MWKFMLIAIIDRMWRLSRLLSLSFAKPVVRYGCSLLACDVRLRNGL